MKMVEFEVPPPGGGLNTVTVAPPGTARSLAGIEAIKTLLARNVVGRGLPFHCTTEPLTNCEPLTTRFKAGEPAKVSEGVSSDRTGSGVVVSAVPVRATVWVLPAVGASSVKVNVPLRTPGTVGLQPTFNEQLPPGVMVAGSARQEPETTNSPADVASV